MCSMALAALDVCMFGIGQHRTRCPTHVQPPQGRPALLSVVPAIHSPHSRQMKCPDNAHHNLICRCVISMCALKLASFSLTKHEKTHAMLISETYLFLVYTAESFSSRLVNLGDNNQAAAGYLTLKNGPGLSSHMQVTSFILALLGQYLHKAIVPLG